MLERRLWARMEKVKAERTARQAPDRQIAKITMKPVPPEKVAVSVLRRQASSRGRQQLTAAMGARAQGGAERPLRPPSPPLAGWAGDASGCAAGRTRRARPRRRGEGRGLERAAGARAPYHGCSRGRAGLGPNSARRTGREGVSVSCIFIQHVSMSITICGQVVCGVAPRRQPANRPLVLAPLVSAVDALAVC